MYFLKKESGCITETQKIVLPDVNDVKKKKKKVVGWWGNQLQNVQLASFALKICSVGAKGMFRKSGIGFWWCKGLNSCISTFFQRIEIATFGGIKISWIF